MAARGLGRPVSGGVDGMSGRRRRTGQSRGPHRGLREDARALRRNSSVAGRGHARAGHRLPNGAFPAARLGADEHGAHLWRSAQCVE